MRILLSVAGSVAVLGVADLDSLGRSRRGRSVLGIHATGGPGRAAGRGAAMGWGGYRRSRVLFFAGVAVIAADWSHPAWLQTRTALTGRTATNRLARCRHGGETRGGERAAARRCSPPPLAHYAGPGGNVTPLASGVIRVCLAGHSPLAVARVAGAFVALWRREAIPPILNP